MLPCATRVAVEQFGSSTNDSITTAVAVATVLLPLLWCCLWLVAGDALGLPGGVLFALFALFGSARAAGRLGQWGLGLPPLLGTLVIGFALRAASDAARSAVFVVDSQWSAALRSLALVVILTRAGLGLDLANVYRLSASVLRLAVLQ